MMATGFISRVCFALLACAVAVAAERETPTAKFEGNVKFYVHRTQQSGTVKLHRLRLADGTHVYTTSDIEVFSLTRSREYQAKVEPMEAYVYLEQKPGTVRLYRFAPKSPDGNPRSLYTAFEPEMQNVQNQESSKLLATRAFVYPHTYQPEEGSDIVPVYCCYSPATGEHFYTTSKAERDSYIEQAKRELALKKQREQEQAKRLEQAKAAEALKRKQEEQARQRAKQAMALKQEQDRQKQNPAERSKPKPVSKTTAAEDLALLHLGRRVGKDHPTVRRFDELIRKIQAKCVRIDDEQVAAVAYTAQTLLRKKGMDVDLLQLMDWLEKSAPEKDVGPYKYEDVAWAFVLMATSDDFKGELPEVHKYVRATLEVLAGK